LKTQNFQKAKMAERDIQQQQAKSPNPHVKYALHHDTGDKRIVTLAYRILDTDDDENTQTRKTIVEYGAAVFRVDNVYGTKDVWSKKLRKAHRDTALGRLTHRPVIVTLTSPIENFDEGMPADQRAQGQKRDYRQFVQSLRDQLHKYGVSSRVRQ
jgi:hypothetical protein